MMDRQRLARELVTLAKEIVASGPSRSDIKKLVEAYALKIFSAREGATIRVQQRLHDKFETVTGRFEEKYPGYDLRSNRFFQQLERGAEQWWNKRAMRGSGVDW